MSDAPSCVSLSAGVNVHSSPPGLCAAGAEANIRQHVTRLVWLARTRQRDDKVKKCPCPGRYVVPGWMVRIEREALIRPVWEQVDEPSLPDQRLGSEQKHLRDACAGQTRVQECARIIHRKPPLRFDNKLFALAMKLPRIRLSGFRIPEFETPVYTSS
jgi:hypothetical protein